MVNGVYIPIELIRSRAFSKLSGKATNVLIYFYTKRVMKPIPGFKAGERKKEWAITNNGKITFFYSEAKKTYSISRGAFCNAIDKLVEVGFIDIVRPGIGAAKIETLYSISDRWKKYGTDEFVKGKRTKRVAYRKSKKSISQV